MSCNFLQEVGFHVAGFKLILLFKCNNILFIRYFEVNDGHGYSIEHLLKQMSETVKAVDGENPWC